MVTIDSYSLFVIHLLVYLCLVYADEVRFLLSYQLAKSLFIDDASNSIDIPMNNFDGLAGFAIAQSPSIDGFLWSDFHIRTKLLRSCLLDFIELHIL